MVEYVKQLCDGYRIINGYTFFFNLFDFHRIWCCWAVTFLLSFLIFSVLYTPDSPPDFLTTVLTLLWLLFLHLTLICECLRSRFGSSFVLCILPGRMVSRDSYIYGLQIPWMGPLTVMVLIGTHVFMIFRFPPATQFLNCFTLLCVPLG